MITAAACTGKDGYQSYRLKLPDRGCSVAGAGPVITSPPARQQSAGRVRDCQPAASATVSPRLVARLASASSKVAIAALYQTAVYSTQQSGSLRPVVARSSPRR